MNTWSGKTHLRLAGTGLRCLAVLAFLHMCLDRIEAADSLGDALDAPGLEWITSGDGLWEPQTEVTHDGVDAAVSGTITANQESRLETTVGGPGRLSFWWRVSSEANWDWLRVYVGWTEMARIAGEIDWESVQLDLGAGLQTIAWVYSKDGSAAVGEDRAWVDQVAFVPGTFPPEVTRSPASQGVAAGGSVRFDVEARGTPPLSYQWYFNGDAIQGASAGTLELTNVVAEQAGSYKVQVSNTAGSATSAAAVLSMRPGVSVTSVGAWPGYDRGEAAAVAVQGDLAYMACGSGGLQIVYIHDPNTPIAVGRVDIRGDAYRVAVSGDYAYVADYYAGLQVIDVSDPTSPVRVGGYDSGGWSSGMAVAGHFAYLAGWAGLEVIDVSDSANPVRVGQYGEYAYAVAVGGNFAYLVSWAGLEVIDVSNPADPVGVGQYIDWLNPGSHATGVAVAGDYAYITLEWMNPENTDPPFLHYMQVIDVSNPSDPVLVGVCETPGGTTDLAVAGNYAYVAAWSLSIIDISSPWEPVAVGWYYSGGVTGLAVTGGYVYAAAGEAGLQVIDASSPTNPTQVGASAIGSAQDAMVVGDHAYVADGYAGLQVIDVSDPASPVRVGGYDTSGYAHGVHVVGNLAYVADGYAGLQVIDVSNPTDPARVGGYDTSGFARGVVVVGNYAYVADGSPSLQVIGVSSPTNLVLVNTYNTSGSVWGVAVAGNYAYVAEGGAGLQVIDVSKPTNLVLVGTCDTSGYAYGVAVEGNHAYVADGSPGLQVIDVSSPTNLVPVSTYNTSGSAWGVAVAGHLAYVADGYYGLEVFDVSDPAVPARVGGYDTAGTAYGVQVTGDLIYVADGSGGLVILQIKDTAPVITGESGDRTVTAGQNVALSVSASGTPPLTYQWYKNGVALAAATGPTLTLANVQPADAGDYYVVVTNALGSAQSRIAILTVLVPPSIVTQPQSQAIALGDPAEFGVDAIGTEPLAYQWQLNGLSIPGATNATLLIPAVSVSDAGNYTVVVSNGAGSVSSDLAVLSVWDRPAITEQPQDVVVAPGNPFTLRVTCGGTPPFEYQWRLNGVNIEGATNATYSIPSAQPTDSGNYSVAVANGVGVIESAVATVIVSPGPLTLTDRFADRAVVTAPNGSGYGVNIGASVEPGEPLHAGKQGGRSVWVGWRAPGDGVVWLDTRGSGFDTLLAVYRGSAVNALTPVVSDEDSGGALTSAVGFSVAAGVEYAIAVDGFAGAEGFVILNWAFEAAVADVPRIVERPRSVGVLPGGMAQLSVVVGAQTPLHYEWYRNGEALDESDVATLVLPSVGLEDVGMYEVEVRTATGFVRSEPAWVELGSVAGVVTEDKLEDLGGGGGGVGLQGGVELAQSSGGFVSVAAGAVGSQVLDNTGSARQAGEPDACGLIGGASRWLKLKAQSSGTMVVDTMGSGVATILSVHTGTSLLDLQWVACGKRAADGKGSVAQFGVQAGGVYLVSADGVGGQQGPIRLNYGLGTAPVVTGQPQGGMVARGGTIVLEVEAMAMPGATYQWWHDGLPVAGGTNAVLVLERVYSGQAGWYRVEVENFAGAVKSRKVEVKLAPEEPARWGECGLTIEGLFRLVLEGRGRDGM